MLLSWYVREATCLVRWWTWGTTTWAWGLLFLLFLWWFFICSFFAVFNWLFLLLTFFVFLFAFSWRIWWCTGTTGRWAWTRGGGRRVRGWWACRWGTTPWVTFHFLEILLLYSLINIPLFLFQLLFLFLEFFLIQLFWKRKLYILFLILRIIIPFVMVLNS